MSGNSDFQKGRSLPIWEEGEYHYLEGLLSWRPNLVPYLHEDTSAAQDKDTVLTGGAACSAGSGGDASRSCTPRPALIVCPGGAYEMCCTPEGQIVAEWFCRAGWNCFVLSYTCNYLRSEPVHDLAARDLSRAIRYVRKHAAEFGIDPEKLAIIGFSAGGHLCANQCVHWQEYGDENPDYSGISNRPQAAVLSYPVISTDPAIDHEASVDALVGYLSDVCHASADPELKDLAFDHYEDFGDVVPPAVWEKVRASKDPKVQAYLRERDHYALETQVTESAVPAFVWSTLADGLVPCENAIRFVQGYRRAGVPAALHIFSDGAHGLSLANEDWAAGRIGLPYTYGEVFELSHKIADGKIPEERWQKRPMKDTKGYLAMEKLIRNESDPTPMTGSIPNAEAAQWPVLAEQFLEKYVIRK